MAVKELLTRAEELGVKLAVKGDKLAMKAMTAPPQDFLDSIRQHKAEVMAMLSAPAMPPIPPPPQNPLAGVMAMLRGSGPPAIPPPPADPLAEAEEVARRVTECGICLVWGETVQDFMAFIKDDYPKEKVPPGFVVYTDSELKELFGEGKHPSRKTLRLIHEAKKQGCRVILKGDASPYRDPDKQRGNRE